MYRDTLELQRVQRSIVKIRPRASRRGAYRLLPHTSIVSGIDIAGATRTSE